MPRVRPFCPTHIHPPCFETHSHRCRNENRFSSQCSALSTPLLCGGGSEKACVERGLTISFSLTLSLRPSECTRGWKSITYHCSNPCRQDLMVCFSTMLTRDLIFSRFILKVGQLSCFFFRLCFPF